MSEPSPPSPVKQKRWSWLKLALIASLAFNALVVGVVLRGAWQIRATLATSPAGLEANLPAFISTLPAERREALGRDGTLARPGVVLRPLRMALRQARTDAARAFLADPFDKQAFVAAQSRVTEAETELRRAVQVMLPEIAERMTAQERRAFVRWRAPGRGGPGGRWGGPPADDGPEGDGRRERRRP